MLEIDYSLIPLSDEDWGLVDEEITRKLRAGEVPRIDKTHFGRVVVLNPDPVQTVHHVPDDLRAHMRRIMVPTMEGPLSLAAERLFREITDSEEPLHFLIVELKSKFAHFPDFLRYLPRLRRRYPGLGVFLATDRATLLERLRELMTEDRIRLDLVYPDARGVVELADPAELGETLSAQEQPVTFAMPFFSQIRLMIGPENRPVVHNLDTLRRLHSQFGVGEAKEIDIGGGRTEKLIVIDLPIRIIRDFQFRQDRGLDFEGITRDGRKIPSRRFDREKLEFRWIPLQSIETFHRRLPGEAEQSASVADIRVLRVNCFNGQVSFIVRTAADQISLADVRSIRFRGLPPPVVADGEENPPSPSEDDYRIDRLLLPSTGLSDLDPVQEAVRDHFYRRIFGEEMERARKLEVYTRGLVVGSVGPLAAQTVKLLRRHGLEQLINPAGFHYLCDSAQQIPDFAQTVERFGERLTGLIESLRKITARDAEGVMRISDFIHNLPLTMEWVDGPGIRYDQAAPQELEVIYREMGTLTRFIAQEFQRTFDIGEAQIAFFQKIHACQEAALVAMWLADFKRGAYGPPLPAGREVDFIFFGTPAEKSENDRTHFFPGLACSEFFRSAQNQQRFARVDYSFSIFFQEQLALAEHHFREGGDFSISLEQYGQFFEQKAAEARQELDGLKGDMAAIDSTDSPEYLRLLREEEKAYHQRYQAFLQDRDRVAEDHRLADEGLLEQVRGMGADFVFASDPDPKWFEGAEPDPGIFDQDLLASLGKTEEKLRRDFDERREVATAKLLEGVANVRATMEAISAAHQKNRDWQLGLQPRRIAEQQALAHGKVAGRTSALKRLAKAALEGHHKRVGVQRRELEAEIRRMNAKIALHERTSVQSIQSMEAVVGRALNPFAELERLGRKPAAQAIRHIEGLAKRLEEISRTLQSLSVKLGRNMEQFQSLLARSHRLAGFQFAISLEEGLLAAAEEKKIPELPPAPQGEERPEAAALGEEFETARQRVTDGSATLAAFPRTYAPLLTELERAHRSFSQLMAKKAQLEKIAVRKMRLRESFDSLNQRQALMEAELADLPKRVREKFMPARKELLLQVFIPAVERKIAQFLIAKGLLEDILRFSDQRLKAVYLDRAVFRRFASHQFRRGCYIGMDSQSPRWRGLQNVLPAVNQLHRALYFNFSKKHPAKLQEVSLQHLRPMPWKGVMELVTNLAAQPEKAAFDYVFLPATLELEEAVEVMNHKMKVSRGSPGLVLVYVGKFSSEQIHNDPAFREIYFRALKHNVILNIDGHALVDNPKAIAWRLLNETLGSTFDTDEVEELPEDETNIAVKI